MSNNYFIHTGSVPTGYYRESAYEKRQEKQMQTRRKLQEFSENTMNLLIAESINYILQQTLHEKSDWEKEYGRVLCEKYVEEKNNVTLLARFEKESLLLAEMASIIKETYEDIICKIDKDDVLTFIIKPSDKKSFFDKLEGLPTSKVVDKINKRVCDAAEEFIQNNINDKLDMEEITAATKARIDASKANSREKLDAIRQEHANYGRQRIQEIQNNRNRNVYEQMVHVASNEILKREELKNKFVTESGKINMDLIIEKVDTAYRFLETINTARIQKVDTAYINELINSIK